METWAHASPLINGPRRITGFPVPAAPSYATARRRYIRRYVLNAGHPAREVDRSLFRRCAATVSLPRRYIRGTHTRRRAADGTVGLTVAKSGAVVPRRGVWRARERFRHAPPSPHGRWYARCIGSPPLRACHVTGVGSATVGSGEAPSAAEQFHRAAKPRPQSRADTARATRVAYRWLRRWYTSPCRCGGAAAARGRWYGEPVASGKSSSADALYSARSFVSNNSNSSDHGDTIDLATSHYRRRRLRGWTVSRK